jgi:RNA polymerase sigma-70 factor (ECF subfamily)
MKPDHHGDVFELILFEPKKHQEPLAPGADDAGREALRAMYRVLDRMSAEERTVFTLRFIDGMELISLAALCKCSPATLKRRLARASARFRAFARSERALTEWLEREAETAARKDNARALMACLVKKGFGCR